MHTNHHVERVRFQVHLRFVHLKFRNLTIDLKKRQVLVRSSAVAESAECVCHFQSPKFVKVHVRSRGLRLQGSFLAWFAARESFGQQPTDRTLSLNRSYLIVAFAAE